MAREAVQVARDARIAERRATKLAIQARQAAKKTAPGIEDRRFQIGARHAIFQGTGETKIEKLARLSGQAEVVGAPKRRGYDIRGKMSAPISRVFPSRSAQAKVARLNGSRNKGHGKGSDGD